ncbi:MAG: hypothetical protein A2Y64_00305 [Candidatus Coatesbacteria bacterium RBG_13_66_14]|uniref:Secretion system C-terminal sorting domain-containing protein n=1 Tax=Candidatus Coatesbacteria bacterium RBG_13_66_14 TaxID=1817816 RepID=A0A1F5EVH7_9BACT|nr:MAG: hypothetical protein A2Y64_00305 [Candidatus Coatesbacteria bacterium RBG_13_66_14]
MKNAMLVLSLLIGMVLANTWSEPVAIVSTDAVELTGGPGTYNQVVDSLGTLHFVFFSDHETPGNREIYYMNDEGGTWSEPLRLSHGDNWSHGPSMAIDALGNITVVWYDYRLEYPYSDLYWCRFDAGTGTWSEDLPLVVVPGSGQVAPLVLAESDGKVHLVWCDGRHGDNLDFELYYRFWENGQWSDELQLTDAGRYFRWVPTMALDGTGNLHLFWADDRGFRKDWHIYYKKLASDGAWGNEIDLGRGAPQDIAIYSGHLFLSQIHSVDTAWDIPNADAGIYDPGEDGPTQVRYSVKNLSDPDDVWVIRDKQVSALMSDDVKQATLASCRSGIRLVWGQGTQYHFNLYQATIGLEGQSAPDLFGPILGDNRSVSLSHGPSGDLNLIYSYTSTDDSGWDLYYRHDPIPREGGFDGYFPPRIVLGSISPNPADYSAVVSFDVPATGNVEVAVYDAAGRRVGTVFSGTLTAGRHELAVDTSGLRSGAYFVQASSDGVSASAPLVVAR